MWQNKFEQYGSDNFTIVGLALDAEGIPPAKIYYDRFGVTFPSLVDPEYATQFGAVPKTFFVDEHGVVQIAKEWEQQLAALGPVRPVTKRIASQWTKPGVRLDSVAIGRLSEAHAAAPDDLVIATQLGSRYSALGLHAKAQDVLHRTTQHYDAKSVAREGGGKSKLLGQAFFQLCRSCAGDRQQQVRHATMSYFLNPTVGLGKQIARIIAPEKFDGRTEGDFDNDFREGTLRRLKNERNAWLRN